MIFASNLEKNHGLGNIYIGIMGHGTRKIGADYPGFYKFSDEGEKAKDGNLLLYIKPNTAAASMTGSYPKKLQG